MTMHHSTTSGYFKHAQSLLLSAIKACARMRNGAAAQRRMNVIETLSLGPKRHLYLVVCDQRHYLVGTGTESIGTIVAIEDHAHQAHTASISSARTQPANGPAVRPWLVNSATPLNTKKPAQNTESASGPGLWQ